MPLCSAQVTSRSNSDMLTIQMISEDVTLSSPARMELIAAAAADWDRATEGSVERVRSKREGVRRRPSSALARKLKAGK